MKVSFRGGVHPGHNSKKPTEAVGTREYVSDTVKIIMNMNIGAPAKPCVKKGDQVKVGQVIGEAQGFMSVPVHASISGTVLSVDSIPYLAEDPVGCVTIQNDFQDEWVELEPLGDVEHVDPKLIIPAVQKAGICGMGGACFPTHVKLSLKPDQKCDTIIVNGAECETHLTADHRLMLENGKRIVDGLRAVMRALDVKDGVIAIEDNKKDAIAAMRQASFGRQGVRVQPMKTKYPQGGEKQLIEAVTGRQVPSGGLPIQVSTVVLNVGTCAAIADAVIDGKPLISRITTVTGCVRNPANLRLRIGTLVEDIIGECGGFSEDPGKIIFGGSMTGLPLPNTNVPVSKSTNGIVVYNKREAVSVDEGPCIRCGKCVSVCPIGLNPFQIKAATDVDHLDRAKELHVMDCILCGSCSYVCPSRRWLTASFKIAKQKITIQAKKEAAQKEAAKKEAAEQEAAKQGGDPK